MLAAASVRAFGQHVLVGLVVCGTGTHSTARKLLKGLMRLNQQYMAGRPCHALAMTAPLALRGPLLLGNTHSHPTLLLLPPLLPHPIPLLPPPPYPLPLLSLPPLPGAVYSRGGLAEVGAPLQLPYSDQAALDGAEALVVRLLADEHPYTCVLRTRGGITYTARFSTRHGYNTVRLPFNTFRPVVMDDPPLQPGE